MYSPEARSPALEARLNNKHFDDRNPEIRGDLGFVYSRSRRSNETAPIRSRFQFREWGKIPSGFDELRSAAISPLAQ